MMYMLGILNITKVTEKFNVVEENSINSSQTVTNKYFCHFCQSKLNKIEIVAILMTSSLQLKKKERGIMNHFRPHSHPLQLCKIFYLTFSNSMKFQMSSLNFDQQLCSDLSIL